MQGIRIESCVFIIKHRLCFFEGYAMLGKICLALIGIPLEGNLIHRLNIIIKAIQIKL